MAIIRVLVSVALVRDRRHPDPRQSRRERHRAGRGPRHRRHRHRPCRAGHLLRPVRGAFDPVRQAVQEGRHDPLRPEHRHGRADRPQDHAAALDHRRAADHGQHQAARARDPQPGRGQGAADDDLPRGGRRASAQSIDAVAAAAAEAVDTRKGCKLIRCALSGAGGGALTFDLVYDDSTRDNDRMAANRSAILRSLIETLGTHKLQLVRASDQPPAPLPF